MNILIVRNQLMKYLMENHFFVYNGSRGFTEEFYGTITKLFSRCFLVETLDHKIKCFSYSDFIIKSLIIY